VSDIKNKQEGKDVSFLDVEVVGMGGLRRNGKEDRPRWYRSFSGRNFCGGGVLCRKENKKKKKKDKLKGGRGGESELSKSQQGMAIRCEGGNLHVCWGGGEEKRPWGEQNVPCEKKSKGTPSEGCMCNLVEVCVATASKGGETSKKKRGLWVGGLRW